MFDDCAVFYSLLLCFSTMFRTINVSKDATKITPSVLNDFDVMSFSNTPHIANTVSNVNRRTLPASIIATFFSRIPYLRVTCKKKFILLPY